MINKGQLIYSNRFKHFWKHYIIDVWQGFENVKVLNLLGFRICQGYTVLQICLNMSDQYLNMPKYTFICQNKNRHAISKVFNVLDAVVVAYSIYPSIFRTLIYSGCSIQNLRDIKNTVKDLLLSISFRILCYRRIFRTLSIFRALPSTYDGWFYSERWNWYNKQWLIKMIGVAVADTINKG